MSRYLDYILNKYGPRLTTGDMADVLNKSADQVRNMIADGSIGFPTGKEGEGRRCPRYADAEDVAAFLDETRPKVAKPASPGPDGYNALKSASPNARKSRPPRAHRTPSQTDGKSPHV